MRRPFFILLIVLQGCASVPKESIALSQELEFMIMNSKRAHLELLDYNMRIQLERIDHFLQTEYIPSYVGSFVDNSAVLETIESLESREEKSAELLEFVQAALPIISKKRSEMTNVVMEINAAIRQSIEAHYQEMLNVNHTLTAHLASATSVVEARKDLRQKLEQSQWIIPIEQMNDSINELLQNNSAHENAPRQPDEFQKER